MSAADAVRWLLDGDPAVRWQTLRDLTAVPSAAIASERARVATEGWGAELLALQGANGSWGGAGDEGWMTTVAALHLLVEFGIDPASAPARTAVDRVREHLRWIPLGGRPFFEGETEACINGRILLVGAYFGERCDALAAQLLDEQLADGGWNCEAPPSRRSSFHSTICVLEGLLAYERSRGATPTLTAARGRGTAYLLDRRMHRSLATGAIVDPAWARFAFPTTYHYDILRGLDHLRDAGVLFDERVAEALGIVEARRNTDGRWPLDVRHENRLAPFTIEAHGGGDSAWNTLRALRVQAWSRRR